jgi:RNA polymerase sigma-70 factor (ECF subfamily)
MAEGAERTDPASPEDVLLMRQLLAEADERQAAAAVYVLMDGMSHEEAAEVLGVSKRTVGNLLERFQAWARERMAAGTEPSAPPTRAPERKPSGFFGFGRKRS